jgi:multicomponent K+:H+ antiporter subunit E
MRSFASVVLLTALWLLLNDSLSVGHVILGAALGVVLLRIFAALRPAPPRVRQLHIAIPLLFTVLLDILRSNWDVGRIALGLAPDSKIHTGFLDIPLELRDPLGLSVLAVIITSTPGTSWAGVSADGRTLTLHVLDLKDEAEWIRKIKQRYEQPLLRMFE